MTPEAIKRQLGVCMRFKTEPYSTSETEKVGITTTITEDHTPLNGMRIPPHGDASGWYIWSGEEFSDDPGFFVPLHIEHLHELRPEVIDYLLLPPGWRFMIATDFEDVWFDAELLTR